MTFDRRSILSTFAGLSAGLATTAALAGQREKHALTPETSSAGHAGLKPSATLDQTATLQAAINRAAERGEVLHLPPGTFKVGALQLLPDTKIVGAGSLTVLQFSGDASFLTAQNASGIALQDLVIDGALQPLDPEKSDALVRFERCKDVQLVRIDVRNALLNAITLEACSGRIVDCTISKVGQAAIASNNAAGLEIAHNVIRECGNNGILVWQDEPSADGTIVSNNRIEKIEARSGGTGENGNGINVFRAGHVLVTSNRITDCAYSAVRGNAASNLQILGNSCTRLGEVALYAEFGFEGAVISNNVVDTAATGISVTNFNEGGRLAVVQGNLIRNLFRREQEPEDKRGEGIGIEADTLCSGNVIEGAPTCGILVGWGKYMRDCMVSQNLIRSSKVGILVSEAPGAGKAMISGNMISGVKDGAIRMMDFGKPIGPELAVDGARTNSRVTVSGNTVA